MAVIGLKLEFTNVTGSKSDFFKIHTLSFDIANNQGNLRVNAYVDQTCCCNCKEPVDYIALPIGEKLQKDADDCVTTLPMTDFPNKSLADTYTALKKYKFHIDAGIIDMTKAEDVTDVAPGE